MTMKLYKFRSLGDELSCCRARKILETGEFWCSRFWELNDPMEGVYSFKAADSVLINEVFSGKALKVICSFSGEDAFENPAMWGYYANGFKGMAIEVEVSEDNVKEVTYVCDVNKWKNTPGADDLTKILTTKLKRWNHEKEFRFIVDSQEPGAKKIGEIKKVYFGDPYAGIVNQKEIKKKSRELRDFLRYRSKLKELAKAKAIDCECVTVLSKSRVTASACK